MAEDKKLTSQQSPKSAIAKVLWSSMRTAPEGETAEQRKAAWDAEKKDFRRTARVVIRRLEKRGLQIVEV